jgi:phage terminase large subunit-like protein
MSAASFRAFCKTVGYPLEPFQRRIANAAFAPERELLVLLPRGNGKTTLFAALAVHHLLTVKRPQAYVAAASREQARILWEAAAEFARHPAISDRITVRHLELRVPGGYLRVLAADALKLHGLTPSLVLVDEYHAHPDDAVYQALRTALLKRPDARMAVISSAPEDATTPLGHLRARALAAPHVTRRGPLIEAHGGSLRMLEWSVPDEAKPTPAQALRANPASWITLPALREQHDAVSELSWLRYHCNRIAGRERAWLPAGAWAACAGRTEFEPGEKVWVAVDLSGGSGRSDTAVCWVNERLHVGVEVWTGEHDAQAEVSALLGELAERFEVTELIFDFWRAAALASEFEQRGLTVVSWPQTDARMIPASKRLYDAIIERRLTHPGDDRLDAHVHAAIARHSRRGWRIDRRGSANTPAENIDGLVALCMALDRAEQPAVPEAEPVRLLGWLG